MLSSVVLSQLSIRTRRSPSRSSDFPLPRVPNVVSPVESADPKNEPVTPLQSADPKTQDLKSFRICRSEKRGGTGRIVNQLRALPLGRGTGFRRQLHESHLLEAWGPPERRFFVSIAREAYDASGRRSNRKSGLLNTSLWNAEPVFQGPKYNAHYSGERPCCESTTKPPISLRRPRRAPSTSMNGSGMAGPSCSRTPRTLRRCV